MSASELHDNLIHRVNVGDSLTRTAARHPRRTAVVDGARRFTYTEFNAWVNRVANALTARGYARGDALALASGNSAEFLVTYYACAKLGVVCVPVNLGWRADEVAYVLGHSKSRGIVVESQLLEAMSDALGKVPAVTDVIVAPGTGAAAEGGTFEELAEGFPDTEPEHVVGDRDPITYLYTSGTTSFPKGVMGNHTAIYLESTMMALEARFTEEDRFVAMMPMFHTAQLNCHCTAAVMVGAAIHVRRGFDAAGLLEQIERERITQIFGLPMMYQQLLEHPDVATRDLSSLRRALYAMAAMPEAQLRQAIEVFGCEFYLLFGQTEMSPTTNLFRPEHQLSHAGAVGSAVVNVQTAIMDADGSLLPQGEVGEIVYRGPHTMTGYLDDAEATAEAFEHGWFHSGDVGYFDADGILWFSDRRKDVIKTGGENVASMEVEKALFEVGEDIAEAVVVGLPHERWTEAITAVVVPKPGRRIDPEALLAGLRSRIDRYKVPKAVIVAGELPRTSTGKIRKNVVRESFAEHYTGGAG
ncbi:long-chain-fatty-acid--CoA ligase [Amycolatopsis acidiphila]|uniref:Long-chain-fatty-acid--CoA ligase n=1 Tax=Amycolatopsis acidiphila TaxID=715473 RepID=A0A557ZXR8_9PSEU|nr:long-chain-fatty-acid--CoA ligase [Amycolatopsis acidiphila]TVT16805.1 long-chain-fatty-acid--CoA ligase [Amycolatopsis acidiphila]UIJ57063.1 long-chain-fatty-acid--CoA ligase [Amycolatopsis acidiphila]GHG53575.1 acyl-CoA synthetase [Amycolatopsis acidiphila]